MHIVKAKPLKIGALGLFKPRILTSLGWNTIKVFSKFKTG
jgi:hypothetical protein